MQHDADAPLVAECTATDFGDWDAYVANHPDATFFHQAAWHRVVADGLGHRPRYLLARASGQVVGVLPLAEVRSRLFGHRLVSLPGCVYGGVLSSSAAAHAALVEAATALAEALAVSALELRNQIVTEPDWPINSLYVTFRRALVADDEANLKAIPRKQRAMVRKGVAAGLVARPTGDINRFYRIYAESVRNLGTPVFPRRYFRSLQAAFGEAVEITVVQAGGQDIAAVMSFYFRDEVLPYYGGSRPAARAMKGNDFMYWEVMCRAARRGVRLFDYGRSKIGSGSYSFKKNWGFIPQPLAYQYHLVTAERPPELNPNNPKYRYFIAVWKHLPLPVANTVGPWLARPLA